MTKGYHYLLTLLLSIILSPAFGQFYYESTNNIIVADSVDTIRVPWAGGFQNPQFSSCDFNMDGTEDLFVFDKTGRMIATFLNGGDSGVVDYDYAPQFIDNIPVLEGFALMYDYNCDGAADLFTGMNLGIRVYKGKYVNNELTFPFVAIPLIHGNGQLVHLTYDDLPAIVDVDFDGDVDILSFHEDGIGVSYYKNRSVEEGLGCDTLWFDLVTNFWGDFEETGASMNMDLHAGHNKTSTTRDGAHAGSTITAFDHDDDGDMDLLVGDISFNEMNMLTNGGTKDSSEIDSQDLTYPSYDVPINFYGFPGAFHVDLNNDNHKDLVLSPNRSNFAHNFRNVWYYKNVDTTGKVILEFQTDRFLSDQMIEVGEAAYPTLFDHDGDGLLDLIIGNYGYFENHGQGYTYWGRLTHFKNIGDSSQPAFEFVTDDYAGLSSLGKWALVPAFADLDGDGDLDMLLGESEGKMLHYENTAGVGNAATFTLVDASIQNLDVGYYSTPTFADVNRDGLIDLVVGERQGSLNYYENEGSAQAPAFKTKGIIWGGVDVRKNALTGYSVPRMVQLDSTEEWYIAVGNEEGQIHLYGVIDSSLDSGYAVNEGDFALLDTAFSGIDVGLRAAPEFADLNNDGKLDIIVGGLAGGLRYFDGSTALADSLSLIKGNKYYPIIAKAKQDLKNGTSLSKTNRVKLKLFPNPANDKLYLILPFSSSAEVQLKVYDALGRVLSTQISVTAGMAEVDVSRIPLGSYFIQVTDGRSVQTERFVVLH